MIGVEVKVSSWSVEAAALRAEVQHLKEQVDTLQAERRLEPEEEEKHEKLKNIYTYAAHAAIIGTPLQCLSACFMLGIVQILAAVFAFAYLDSSWLSQKISMEDYPQFGSIHPGNYYGVNTVAGIGIPVVVRVAASIGVVLLVTITRSEDMETLQTPFPLAIVICHPEILRKSIWRVVPLAFILFCWMVRALLVPVSLCLGGAFALASSDNAQEIVLNSVAAGFLLDLDSMAYALLVGVRRREQYEASKPPPGCPLVTDGTDVVIEVYSWLVWAPGVFFSLFFLFEADARDTTYIFSLMQIGLIMRGVLFGFAQAHVALTCSRPNHRSRTKDDAQSKASVGVRAAADASACSHVLLALGLLSIVVATTLLGWVAHLIRSDILDWEMGWRTWGLDTDLCLQECLHTFPGATNGSTCYSGIILCSGDDSYSYE